ncbi:hypothetical protein BDQ17DRAFT_218857 [Cyathus striatus]|nr:hypothetical protein BDQ17DRAFT_218857 [Cyathus striatus]
MSRTDPPRVFRREWKWNKPHLPKSTSLPEMQLAPESRPLFTCGHCGFSNSLVPLCLWCRWTSPEAILKFEQSTPRARRITAPTKASWNVSVSMSEEDKSKMNNISTEKAAECHHQYQPTHVRKSSFTSEVHETPIRDKTRTSTARGKSTNAQRPLRPQLSLNTLLDTTSTGMERQKQIVATGIPISADCNFRGPGDCFVSELSMSPDHKTRRESRCRIENNNGFALWMYVLGRILILETRGHTRRQCRRSTCSFCHRRGCGFPFRR